MTELEKKRHSLAHLLAAATLKLYPNTKITLGPAVENGFYYDMDFENPISDSDLKKIQKTMKKMANSWTTFEHKKVSPDEAREFFAGNEYKLELIDEIAKNTSAVVLLGELSMRLADACYARHIEVNLVESLDEAVEVAIALCHKHHATTIALSPGGSSYDMFKNYKVRGETFIEICQTYLQA